MNSLKVEENAEFYLPLRATWPRPSDFISIQIGDYGSDLRIPLPFVRGSGDNTWGLVHHMLSCVVAEKGRLEYQDGTAVGLELAPEECTVRFVPVGEANFTWTEGPQSSVVGKPFGTVDFDGNYDSHANSETLQELREELLGRDGRCVVSDAGLNLCKTTHLVPATRTDIYEAVLGADFDMAYTLSVAVLLSANMKVGYDQYLWSFYCKENDDALYVHVFEGTEALLAPYHGRRIPRERFRIIHDPEECFELPDRRLCQWHYAQSIQKSLRAFSAGLSGEAANNSMST